MSEVLLPFGIALSVFFLAFGGVHLFDTHYPALLPSTVLGIVLGGLLALAGMRVSRKIAPLGALEAGSLVVFLVLLSDVPTRRFSLFAYDDARWLLLFALLAGTLLLGTGRNPARTFSAFPIACLVAGAAGMALAGGGRLLFSDDHPAFLYRLAQLKSEFPGIPFYNPLWNAGVDAREFFPSGTLAIFFLFAPLVYAFELPEVYNVIVCLELFAVIPAAIFAAARLARLAPAIGTMAALLSVSCSLMWYRWALVYGTLGFVSSCGLYPLAVVLWLRLTDVSIEKRAMEGLVTIVVTTLVALWSPSILALLPMGLIALLRIASLARNRYAVTVTLLVVAVNLPWIAIFVQASKVASFATLESTHHTEEEAHAKEAGKGLVDAPAPILSTQTAKGVFRRLRVAFESVNPVVPFVGVPGLALLSLAFRRGFAILAGWLVLLALLGPALKPQLELERMFFFGWMLLSIPAAAGCGALWDALKHRSRVRAAASLAPFAILATTPVFVFEVTRNAMVEKAAYADEIVGGLADAIRVYGGSGRTLFAGFILHELSHGHVAPLPLWSGGRPLVASRYQHDRWEYIDVVPQSFRERGRQGVEEFFDLMNVTAVVTHDRDWRRRIAGNKERYRQVWNGGRFRLFERKVDVPSYFVEGRGEVFGQTQSAVEFRLDTPHAVLSYSYFPWLEVPGCELAPHPVAPALTFVRVSGCREPGRLVLRSVAPHTRFFGIGR